METVIFGIRNCDTMKKALHDLQQKGLAFRFHDYKKEGVPQENLQKWIEVFGWEKIVNRQGLTWKKLSDAEKAAVCDAPSAIEALSARPSMIRRPILEHRGKTYLGWDPATVQAIK